MYDVAMLSRLRTSPTLHRLALGLALLLPLSLNAAAGDDICGSHAEPGAVTSHAEMLMPGHADMDDGHGDCGDSVCQTACGGTTAMAAPETAPVTPTRHAETGPAPATAPQAGYHELPLRPPLSS